MSHERRQGPGILVFGRLAPGFTLEDAQAEGGALMNGKGALLLPAVAVLMTTVGLLASVGAARCSRPRP